MSGFGEGVDIVFEGYYIRSQENLLALSQLG